MGALSVSLVFLDIYTPGVFPEFSQYIQAAGSRDDAKD